MLKKSTKSAIVMSGIAFLSSMLTFLFWELLLSRSKTNVMAEFQPMSSSGIAISFFIILITLIVFVLPSAFIIHNLSDTYFGKEGAIRWGIFGIVCGCLAQIRLLIPSSNLDKSFMSFAIDKGLNVGLGLVILYVSHFLVFKLLKRKA